MHSKGSVPLILLAVTLFATATLLAQVRVSGTITGTITDETGAVVPNVELTLTGQSRGVKLSATTNEAGFYVFDNLDPGPYTLASQAAGFASAEIRDIQVMVAEVKRIDVSLKVGAVTEKIEVTGAVPVIQTERTEISSVVSRGEIQQLPMNGHQRLNQFLIFAPGIHNVYGNTPWMGRTVSVYGGFSETVDGAVLMSTATGFVSGGGDPPWDAVQEFRFVADSASAENFLIGGIVVTTRSGTNEFHGDVWWQNRNRVLAARNVLDHSPTRAPYNRNEFGATLSGPIKRDKLFFLGTYEKLTFRSSSNSLWNMPTAAMKSGDFSGFLPGKAIIDPLSGSPFPSNRIPADRISPQASTLAQFYPDPNLPGTGPGGTGANFNGLVPNKQGFPRWIGKVDYHPSSNDALFAGFTKYDEGPNDNSSGGPAQWGRYFGYSRQRQARFGWTRVLSPRTTGEFRGAWSTQGQGQSPVTNADFDPGALFPDLNKQCCGELVGGDKKSPGRFSGGLPRVNITSYTGLWDFQRAADNVNDLNGSGTLSYVRGGHFLKVGGYYWRSQYRWNGIREEGRGAFDMTSRYTRDGFADFLLGFADHCRRGSAFILGDFNTKLLGGFLQDDWKVTRRLTLNLGLRWDVQTTIKEKQRRQATFIPELNAIVTFSGTDQFPPGTVQRLVDNFPILTGAQAGMGTPENMYNTSWLRDTLSPRLGFAYRPFADSKTVIRGGAGIYRQFLTANQFGLLYDLFAPFGLDEDFFSPPGDTPFVTFANPFPGLGDIPSAPAVWGFPRDFPRPYTAQWNLTVEREVLPQTSLRISYAGSKLTHGFLGGDDLNRPQITGPGTLQQMRPFQPWGTINWLGPGHDANKNSLQIGSIRRSADLTYQIQYQWTKAIDNMDWSLDNPWDFRNERGNTEDIARHRLVMSWVYRLPFGKQRRFLSAMSAPLDYALGGWQLSGISIMRTGVPLTVMYSSGRVGYPTSGRADVVGDWRVANPSESQWFNPKAFREPAPFTFGNVGRNSLYGPGFWSFDVGIFKDFKFYELYNLQVRSEWFNLFNHPNLMNPRASLSDPSIGRITSFSGPRAIQLGLRLDF